MKLKSHRKFYQDIIQYGEKKCDIYSELFTRTGKEQYRQELLKHGKALKALKEHILKKEQSA
tara:strand:- start:58 stop:243 length:186 start_codon:yes stop_codon:yes gene_type:complete